MIMSENGIHNNEENFSYSGLVKLNEYEAFSIVNDKGKEKKIKVTQVNDRQMNRRGIFYDDVREKQLIFTNLEAGARKVYSVQTEFLDPFLLQTHVFGNSFPMLNSVLEVRADKDISIGYKVFNDAGNTIEFTKTEKKGKYIYRWALKNAKAVKIEPGNPGFLHVIPHIDLFIKDYKAGDKKIDVLDDTPRLYEYYKSFLSTRQKLY
ncbi:hypothetical protein CHU92_14335 [Flavobacterium cyanobacteriorum]|uniref:DUF3857 domain-containing protein n=2 Tax=Flavobacterium cyanobacteriorum TaxID=2022802 RepID=A0A255YS85_9FLAO|nr:hypothetical protein CHU92_14335 [Flavobacterium cyanobacteriorum]